MKYKHKTTNPKLCDFNKVTLNVPRLKLLKLAFKKTYLNENEFVFLKALLWETEAADNKIRHVQSLVRKALLKTYSNKIY